MDYEADEYHTEVTIEYDENQAPRPRYMDIMHEALEQARANADPSGRARRDTGNPKIAGVMPGKGSPKGGLLVTIYGENLRSKKIDLGGQESESDNEGIRDLRTLRAGPYLDVVDEAVHRSLIKVKTIICGSNESIMVKHGKCRAILTVCCNFTDALLTDTAIFSFAKRTKCHDFILFISK